MTGDRPAFVGRVVERGGARFARDMFQKDRPDLPLVPGSEGEPPPGSVIPVQVEAGPDGPVARCAGPWLAPPNSARAAMYAIAARHGLDPTFPPAVMREAAAFQASPGLDDPALRDQTDKPFVTIDNEDSKDLDQAMHIERRPGGGYEIFYALADASYYVRPGTAVFKEALRRSSSYYLPGLCIPMLPPAMSEGIVSLNEGVLRRALVLRMRLAPDGQCESTRLVRAKMRSVAKLSYNGVQRYAKDPDQSPLRGRPFAGTLDLLEEVGRLLVRRAEQRDVVRYQRTTVKVGYGDEEGRSFTVLSEVRNDVERWNEQISLLCNVEGARFFRRDDDARLTQPGTQAIFRVHDAPPEQRVAKLASLIDALVEAADLDEETWRWRRAGGESLADYLARLPTQGEAGRRSRALHRQALVINVRSMFTDAPGGHHGVGTPEGYMRFSSPMREMVGVFTHKEALELLVGRSAAAPGQDDEALRQAVIKGANEAKRLQGRITKEANKLAIDALFRPDLALPSERRPVRAGTVMGLSRGKIYVQLDDPPIEVKVYLEDLARVTGQRYKSDPKGVCLKGDEGASLPIGAAIDVRIHDYDEKRGRWLVRPVPSRPEAP